MALQLIGGGTVKCTLSLNSSNELCFNSNPIIPIGFLACFYLSAAPDATWLVCDGSRFNIGTYAKLYNILGTDTVPDYRECAIVGIGQNDSEQSNLATHDVYTLGEFKDDAVQTHSHYIGINSGDLYRLFRNGTKTGPEWYVDMNYGSIHDDASYNNPEFYAQNVLSSGRSDKVTRGKRKGALICIKAA